MSKELDDLNRRIEDAQQRLYALYKERKALKKPTRKKLTGKEIRARTLSMLRDGYSPEAIAKALKYNTQTVRGHIKEAAFEEAERRCPLQIGVSYLEQYPRLLAEQKRILAEWLPIS